MTESSQERGFTLLELAVVVAILVLLAALVVGKVDQFRDHAETTATRATLNTVREAFVGSATSTGYIADLKTLPGFNLPAIRLHDLLSPASYPEADQYDPVTQRGWRGPYLDNVQPVLNTKAERKGLFPAANDQRSANDTTFLERNFYETAASSPYGMAGDRCAADAWGNPIVIQVPPASEFPSTPPALIAKQRFHYARAVSAGPDGILATPLDRLAGMEAGGGIAERSDDLVIFFNRADVFATEADEQGQ